MVRILLIIVIALAGVGLPGCKEKPEENKVDLEQINPDDSNDYQYIFREEIQKEKEREKKIRKKEFNGGRP